MARPLTAVAEYLAGLTPERRAALETVRSVILENLAPGFEEGIQYGMIGYSVPHSVYPQGYHCDPAQPVPFLGLAAQKNHLAVYLFCLYTDPEGMARFQREWKASGKRLDMGKSCLRFKKVEDLALDVLGAAVGGVTLERFLATYEAGLPASARKGRAAERRRKT